MSGGDGWAWRIGLSFILIYALWFAALYWLIPWLIS